MSAAATPREAAKKSEITVKVGKAVKIKIEVESGEILKQKNKNALQYNVLHVTRDDRRNPIESRLA